MKTTRTLKRWWVWLVVWAGTAAVFLSGHWDGSATPGQDAAAYLYQVERSVDTGTILWRGYFSSIHLDHPGPIMYWVLALGAKVGGFLGHSHTNGSVVAYVVACAGLLTLTARIMTRAVGPIAGAGVVAVAWFLQARYSAQGEAGALAYGVSVFPLYGPSFASWLTLAGVAAGGGAVLRQRSSALWAMILGGWMIQINVTTAVLGVPVIAVGTVMWWRAGQQRRFVGVGAGWILGVGALFGRWADEGLSLPVRYVRDVIETNQRVAAGSGRVTLLRSLEAPVGSISLLWVAAGIVVGLVGVAMTARRMEVWLSCMAAVSGAYVMWSAHEPHHSAHISAYLPVVIGGGTGALIDTFLRRKAGGRVWVGVQTLVVGAVAVFMMVGGVRLAESRTFPDDIVMGTTSHAGLVAAVEQQNPHLLGVITARVDMNEDVAIGSSRKYEVYLGLESAGIPYCSASRTDMTIEHAPPCGTLEPDVWLVFSRDPTAIAEPEVARYDPNPFDNETDPTMAYLVERLEPYGFTWCPGRESWFYRSSCFE